MKRMMLIYAKDKMKSVLIGITRSTRVPFQRMPQVCNLWFPCAYQRHPLNPFYLRPKNYITLFNNPVTNVWHQ
jgi:hypothetical protein